MENVKDTDQYLVINQEQIRGKGEDFFLFEEDQRKIIMGVLTGAEEAEPEFILHLKVLPEQK